MFGLVVAVAALAQVPEYVEGYKPKVGDKVVLARDEAASKIPIAKTDGAALGFKDVIDGPDSNYEAVVGDSTDLTEIDGGTSAQIIENVKYLKDPIFFKVRILDGPLKGKTAFAYAKFCRKPDPAYAKAAAERRKKRAPLDNAAIVAELKDALDKAKPNDASAGLSDKKKIVRQAVEPICEKHNADFKEIHALATKADVFVMLNGAKYDIAGNRVRK
jgi:hypothetical protein